MSVLDAIARECQQIERDVSGLIDLMTGRPWAADFPDWYDPSGILNFDAVKIYFIRRGDGSLYATTKNRHLYGETVIDTTVVHCLSEDWSIQTSPVVADHLKELQARVKKCSESKPASTISPIKSRRGYWSC